jgi:uncharacterized membrane protein
MAAWTIVKNSAKGLAYIVAGAVGGLVSGVCGAAAYIGFRVWDKMPDSGVPVDTVFDASNFSIPNFINCVGAHQPNCTIPVDTTVVLRYVSTPIFAGALAGASAGVTVGVGLFAYNLYQQRQKSRFGVSFLGGRTGATDSDLFGEQDYLVQNNDPRRNNCC